MRLASTYSEVLSDDGLIRLRAGEGRPGGAEGGALLRAWHAEAIAASPMLAAPRERPAAASPSDNPAATRPH